MDEGQTPLSGSEIKLTLNILEGSKRMRYKNYELKLSSKVGCKIEKVKFTIDQSFVSAKDDPEGRIKRGRVLEGKKNILMIPVGEDADDMKAQADEFNKEVPKERIAEKENLKKIMFGLIGTLTVYFQMGTYTFKKIAFAKSESGWWLGGAKDGDIFHCSANPVENCVVYYTAEKNTAFTVGGDSDGIIFYNFFHIDPWMGKLKNDLCTINTLSIPGTHQSGTMLAERFTDMKKCQNTSIYHQLFLGIRCFDLRIYTSGNVGHDNIRCFINIEDIVRWCQNFMEHFPTEAIMIRLANSYGNTIDDVVRNTIENPGFKDLFLDTNENVPTLKEARGKILSKRKNSFVWK